MFAELRELEPYHMEGMDLYSTALWQLQREVELSALAQELTEMNKNAPEVGKYFKIFFVFVEICCFEHG